MKETSKKKSFIKFTMWFTFLSTLGVGGGIFFLLFVVVPVEQMYENRGWSQFKIDGIMKYYVFGWVVFGFIISFVYYYFTLKQIKWKLSIILMVASIILCISGLYYFLNTGTGVVAQSQGQIEEGERFTFGPYPEKEDLERLKAEGYDGVITLLSPKLPIEKPLLDKEKQVAEETGIPLHSMPMLPWVGDNSETIENIKKLIQQDDKKYYVHCYLGRHRVDVVKQLINQELDSTYVLNVLQPTTFERGSLYYFDDEEILIGPYPTDEEWFTRVKRGEVKEVVSLLEADKQDWIEKEMDVVSEMGLLYTSMPLGPKATRKEIIEIAEYVMALDHKVFVHNFVNPAKIQELEAYISWKKMIHNIDDLTLEGGEFRNIGAKVIIGFEPTIWDKQKLKEVGIEQYVYLEDNLETSWYHKIQEIKNNKLLTYLVVNDLQKMAAVEQMATGLFYGSNDRGKRLESITLGEGNLIRHERNLLIGPVLNDDEFESFALKNGVAQLLFLYSASITPQEKLDEIRTLAYKYQIPLKVISMHEGYENELVPSLNSESGLNYIMTEKVLMENVNLYLKQF